jgi:hypothetical protein
VSAHMRSEPATGTDAGSGSLHALSSPGRPAFGEPRSCGCPAIVAKLGKEHGLRYKRQDQELLRWIGRLMIKPEERNRGSTSSRLDGHRRSRR